MSNTQQAESVSTVPGAYEVNGAGDSGNGLGLLRIARCPCLLVNSERLFRDFLADRVLLLEIAALHQAFDQGGIVIARDELGRLDQEMLERDRGRNAFDQVFVERPMQRATASSRVAAYTISFEIMLS